MSLYIPSHFQGEAWEEVVNKYPLATVISPGPVVSHLPLLLERRENETFLLGHLARANPQVEVLNDRECLAIFHGPEGYISPTWYQECDVPTWNYVVVHVEGTAKLLNEQSTLTAIRKLSEKNEGATGWKFQIPTDLQGALMRHIAGFEIRVKKVQPKFKLSQNRSSQDRAGIAAGLKTRGSKDLLSWMSRN